MERPAGICEPCFEKNRITHNAGDGDELIVTYCTHSRTGAHAERRGERCSAWQVNQVPDERAFWALMRLNARFCRGEITQAQLAAEISRLSRRKGGG